MVTLADAVIVRDTVRLYLRSQQVPINSPLYQWCNEWILSLAEHIGEEAKCRTVKDVDVLPLSLPLGEVSIRLLENFKAWLRSVDSCFAVLFPEPQTRFYQVKAFVDLLPESGQSTAKIETPQGEWFFNETIRRFCGQNVRITIETISHENYNAQILRGSPTTE